MTTIAWDGRSLAGDQALSTHEGMTFRAHKLRRTPDGRLLGAAGHAGACAAYLDWLGGDRSDPKPSFQDTTEEYVVALEISPSGEVRTHGRYTPVVLIGPIAAIGSGAPYALGAMAAGKTAAEAVAIAAQFDTGTGGPVDVLDLHVTVAARIGRRVAQCYVSPGWVVAHERAVEAYLAECTAKAFEPGGSPYASGRYVIEHPKLPIVDELESIPLGEMILRDGGRRCELVLFS